ncbi:hypothetical protein H6G81_28625 [Scytonema hofmannii FACHB-248]|uniref:Uncharacterized protein n=1 Tax=Scytonema hofmannii FACHB-248 TaxID=1842502 RepID=A0ABR8GYU1_9CYAN|nr:MULTISPECIES: hypothetical protein [Nostocales]MBD2608377.1 hypothetical protein [Scytonema hofmannii FACHB-248]
MDKKDIGDDSKFREWKNKTVNSLRYARIICLLVSGKDINFVAKEIGVSVRTIERYFNDEQFQYTLTTAIKLTFRKGIVDAALFADKAIQILIEISEDNTNSVKYRLQAIQMIFTICLQSNLQNLQETPADTTANRLSKQAQLLSSVRTVEDLIGVNDSRELVHKIKIENQKNLWQELYPNTDFPDEDIYQRLFNDSPM